MITKGLDVKKEASTAEVKVNDLLAKHNLPLATRPLSKSIFAESNIAKGHSIAKEKCLFIINIFAFENKNHNHQVRIFFCTWDLNQLEPALRGY